MKQDAKTIFLCSVSKNLISGRRAEHVGVFSFVCLCWGAFVDSLLLGNVRKNSWPWMLSLCCRFVYCSFYTVWTEKMLIGPEGLAHEKTLVVRRVDSLRFPLHPPPLCFPPHFVEREKRVSCCLTTGKRPTVLLVLPSTWSGRDRIDGLLKSKVR